LVALAAFSKDQQLDKLRSAALLCPIAYVGQMTSPVAKNAADHFIAEVTLVDKLNLLFHQTKEI
jgi:lysosomal acid lipase/cholesteryl ester hydrolase